MFAICWSRPNRISLIISRFRPVRDANLFSICGPPRCHTHYSAMIQITDQHSSLVSCARQKRQQRRPTTDYSRSYRFCEWATHATNAIINSSSSLLIPPRSRIPNIPARFSNHHISTILRGAVHKSCL